MRCITMVCSLSLLLVRLLFGTETGQLTGTVLDARTASPLAGANVLLLGTKLGAATDLNGSFLIDNLPLGVYNLEARMMGYAPQVRTDIVIRPKHDNPVEILLEATELALDEVVVRPDYFATRTQSGGPSVSFQREEVRRAPGSAEDVSRIVQNLPSVGMGMGDDRNDLIVRGGNPMENLILLDGHPVSNIDHYSTQGSTGGPIGMLAVDMLDDVQFSAGGFDTRYGNRLSSVMDLRFREGDREHLRGKANLSMGGAGATLEGPLSGSGSWLFTFRRSYLELLKSQIGTDGVPVYSDLSGKVIWEPAKNWTLGLVLLGGQSLIEWSADTDDVDEDSADESVYDEVRRVTTGLSLRHVTQSGTVDHIRYTLNHMLRDDVYSTWNNSLSMSNNSIEAIHTLEVSRDVLRKRWDLRIGLGSEYEDDGHHVVINPYIDDLGQAQPGSTTDHDFDAHSYWSYGDVTLRPFSGTSLRAGLRADYFEAIDEVALQPRAGLRQDFSDRWSFDLTIGVYAQNLPGIWLSQQEEPERMEAMRCLQYQCALEYRPQPWLLCSVEPYYRKYSDLPVSGLHPEIPVNNLIGGSFGFPETGQMTTGGEGRSYGVEFLVRRKLAKGVYGMLSYAWSKAEYRTPSSDWILGAFDRPHSFSLVGGWLINSRWELSGRWRYCSGAPTTPLDEEASIAEGHTIRDYAHYLSERLPMYHRLDLRVDHRIHGKRWDWVVYFDMQNVYNRSNVNGYYFRREALEGMVDGQPVYSYKREEVLGWSIMPVGGFSVEF